MVDVIGVQISWLTLARNADLRRLISSAFSLAGTSSCRLLPGRDVHDDAAHSFGSPLVAKHSALNVHPALLSTMRTNPMLNLETGFTLQDPLDTFGDPFSILRMDASEKDLVASLGSRVRHAQKRVHLGDHVTIVPGAHLGGVERNAGRSSLAWRRCTNLDRSNGIGGPKVCPMKKTDQNQKYTGILTNT